MKPLIGVTSYCLRDRPPQQWAGVPIDYFKAVQRSGGIPVLLPFCQTEEEACAILARVDGLLLSGGGDVDPQLYGQQPHTRMGAISPERDTTEMAYSRVALKQAKPILGICRGHQLLAVVAGGSLYQDLPSQVPGAMKHFQDAPRSYPTHGVRVVDGCLLAALLGREFAVNSFHHQAVKAVPAPWVITAQAQDGVVEALENPDLRFAMSVQWHPECFTGRDDRFEPLFATFVASCQ